MFKATSKVGLACALAALAFLAAVSAPAAAHADNRAALVKAVDAYLDKCGAVASSQGQPYQDCVSQEAELKARQKKLGVSDNHINARLGKGTSAGSPIGARGGWRGWPYP